MSNLPHYFIAISLPAYIRDYFLDWQIRFREKLPFKQWMNNQDLHITLQFLGPTASDIIENVHEELKQVKSFPAFSVELGSIGTFGNPKKPRILWVGVEPIKQIHALHRQITMYTSLHGFAVEKRNFTPHITLAKKWDSPSTGENVLKEVKTDYVNGSQGLRVQEITLFRIYPAKSPKYAVISRYPLNGGGVDGTIN